MSYLTEQLAAVGAANLVRLVPPVAGDLGYGRDLVCVSDLTPNLDEEDPDSPVSIGHHAYRMLATDRDSIPDAPGRGYNIARLLNTGMTPLDLLAQEGLIRQEVMADDRIDNAIVACAITGYGRTAAVRVTIQITPQNPKSAAFTLILAIAADGQTMLELLK